MQKPVEGHGLSDASINETAHRRRTPPTMTGVDSANLWIGTYPVAGQGTPTGCGEGVWRADMHLTTGRLSNVVQVAQVPAPSWLSHDPQRDLLYAVAEAPHGGLSVLRDATGAVEVVSRIPIEGSGPCHVLRDDALNALIISNYGSGTVSVVRLNDAGMPNGSSADQVLHLQGSGPNLDRQAGPHAHYALPTPDGSHVLVVDLGADAIHRFRRDVTRRRLVDDGIAVQFPPGTGPRHAVFSRDGQWLYVVGELDGSLHTVAWSAREASGRLVEATRALPREGTQALAHLTLKDQQLTVGVRGANVLAIHDLTEGIPRFVTAHVLPGDCPRHHAHINGWTVVAQQNEGGVAVLNEEGSVVSSVGVPSAAFVLPVHNQPGSDGSQHVRSENDC